LINETGERFHEVVAAGGACHRRSGAGAASRRHMFYLRTASRAALTRDVGALYADLP
jgi:hypothetical protein